VLGPGPVALALIVILGNATAAAAAEPYVPFTSPSAALNLLFGFETPAGALGAEVELDPFRWLALGFGGGVSEDGLQGAAQVRGRIPLRAPGWAITVGGGGSRGRYHSLKSCESGLLFEPPKCYSEKEGHVWLGTAEVGVERDVDSGIGLPVRVRGFAGLKLALNPEDVHCLTAPFMSCEAGAGPVFFIGVSGGFAFPLTSPPPRR